METTGILHSVCSYKEKELTCELAIKEGKSFSIYRCTGSLYSQARALDPGQEVTIMHEPTNRQGVNVALGIIGGSVV